MTQSLVNTKVTMPATGRQIIDPADTLFAVVKSFNTRQEGREYASEETLSMFEAVKLFNQRRAALAS